MRLFFAANAAAAVVVLQVVVETLDDDANALQGLEAGLSFALGLGLVLEQGVPDGLEQDRQAGAGQALFPFRFGRLIFFGFDFLLEDIQHRLQVGLEQPFSGVGVGFKDEGAQSFPKFVQIEIAGFGAEGFRDFQGVFIQGFVQFGPGFFLFAGGLEVLMGDKGAGFLEQGFAGLFFNQEGRDSPEGQFGVEALNQVAEAVKVGRIGHHVLFEKFSEFGEAAGTDFKKLLNKRVQLVDFSVGGS